MTDANGNFEFKEVPRLVPMRLAVVVPDVDAQKPRDRQHLGERYFRPNEDRPIEKVRLRSKSDVTRSRQTIEEILAWRTNDCRLLGMHLLVAIPGEGDAEEFAKDTIADYDTHRSLLRYFPTILNGETSTFADRAKYFKQRGWSVPSGNKTLFVVLDGSGKQLAERVVDGDKPETLANAVLFFDANVPKEADGRKKYDER